MAMRIGGVRRKTRRKLRRELREKGKLSVSEIFKTFNTGDKVILKPNSAYQDGCFFFNYTGKHGTIVGKRGKCYEVKIVDGKKEKLLIVHPIHLKSVKQ
ncbi:MAG: 50S ribosomal protein L21e [Candidatus Woesearchaeota archaeon]